MLLSMPGIGPDLKGYFWLVLCVPNKYVEDLLCLRIWGILAHLVCEDCPEDKSNLLLVLQQSS